MFLDIIEGATRLFTRCQGDVCQGDGCQGGGCQGDVCQGDVCQGGGCQGDRGLTTTARIRETCVMCHYPRPHRTPQFLLSQNRSVWYII
jgi:hypothetical protein